MLECLESPDKDVRDTILPHDVSKPLSDDTVKSLRKVNEVNVHRSLPILALLKDAPQSKDLLRGSPSRSKSCLSLLLSIHLVHSTLYPVNEDPA